MIYDVININFGNFVRNSVIGTSKFARGKTKSEQQYESCQVEVMTSQTLLVTFFISINRNLQNGIATILDSSMLLTRRSRIVKYS